MHGADRDILWLQRDFGIDVYNMFDTGQYLLKHFCDVAANKEYAREDTHYLLYIYDLMKRKLLLSSTDPNCPEASLVKTVGFRLYDADLNGQQLAIVAGLCERRDVIARLEDKSTGSILPNKVLIEIGNANGVAFEPVAKKIVEDDYLTRMKIVKEIHEHN
ncbi:putative HRDC-like superfamily, ribonuclease H-like superfamily [Helianthus anomalus]